MTTSPLFQDICSGTVIEPTDVPQEIRHAEMIYAALKYSDKPIMGSALGKKDAEDSVKMASILFGIERELVEPV